MFYKLFVHIDSLFIQSTSISHNNLSAGPPEGLRGFLITAKNMEYLKLNDCNLKNYGTVELLHQLVKSKHTLKYLDISSNYIDEGAKKIGKFIKQLKYLETLKLSSNFISYKAANDFINDIADCKLRCLDLTDNELDEACCSLLGKMFGKHKMKRLQNGRCYIGDSYLEAFLNGWRDNINKEERNGYVNEQSAEIQPSETDLINRSEINDNIKISPEA
ncbi:hypothetical protein CDIK_3651 [Cucumispora dikerogammari]|nr:hypothetical protein CDIK_3651 [Cucumispora dikerogammari]